MSEVNALWASAWRQLQKNLAIDFANGGATARKTLFSARATGNTLANASWLVRARSRETRTRAPFP